MLATDGTSVELIPLYGPTWPGLTDFNVEPAARIDYANAPVHRGNMPQGFVRYRYDHEDFNVTD
jgi:hypothetical protein